jgi:osmoprotectant transport system substrate-binding protein
VPAPHRRLWSALLAVAVAAAAMAVAPLGCGGDDAQTRAAPPTATRPALAPIRIGTKNFTEEFILGELYSQALRAKGFPVTLRSNIGASEITHQALLNKVLDMYPEYVGTLLSEVADMPNRPASTAASYALAKRFEERRGFTLLAPTPFSDDEALAVTPKFAAESDVHSLADLKRVRRLRIGAPAEFSARFEGLVGLREIYGVRKPRFTRLDFDKRYPSLDSGKVDVAAVFTTERQLTGNRYLVLDDPRGLFAVQHVAPIINKKVLAAHGPRLAAAIDAVSAKLTTAAMRRMNGAVDLDGRSPRAVATEFLRSQGLL